MAPKAPIPKATGKKKAAPAKPKTLREELIEAGKARNTSAPPPDPAVVLAEIQATLAKMDASMDQVGDAADEATVRLSVEMGATDAEIEALKAKQAARKAEKQAKRDKQAKHGRICRGVDRYLLRKGATPGERLRHWARGCLTFG